jgi:enamine deaminase RidA (YjgF/YER057c/UK114 family)
MTTSEIDRRLAERGVVLPPAVAPVGNYVPALIVGDLLHISGQLPKEADGRLHTGLLGGGLSIADGQAAARVCGLNVLAQAKAALGSLDRIRQTVRLCGFVACTPDFFDQPQVVNGASDLMVAVLGDKGRHVRAAVGVASLPAGAAVEVEATFAIVA